MDDNDVRKRFLDAEQEASEIIDTVSRLREEISSYRDVRESLAEAVEATHTAANHLTPVSVKLKELLLGLDELGLPDFREDLSHVRDRVADIDDGQGKLVARTGRLLEESAYQERAKGQDAQLAKVVAELKREIAALADGQRVMRRWTIGLLVLLVVLVIAMGLMP